MTVDIAIMTLFMLLNCLIGYYSSKKIQTVSHYSVGNRAFSSFAVFATLSASFIGGGYTIGNAAKVYNIGMIYSFALLGFSLTQIIMALWIAPRMDEHRDCHSVGEIMAKKYGTTVQIITGVMAMIICAGLVGAQVSSMGAIFHYFFNISPFWGIMIGFSVILFYSSLGGMSAVVYTDIFQFLILIVGIPAAFLIGLHAIGGWHELTPINPTQPLSGLQNGSDWLTLAALFTTFMFGEILLPPYVQRLFMARSSRDTRNATLCSALLSMPFLILVGAIGLIAATLNPHLSSPHDALLYVVQQTLPPVIRGFVIAGIIAVIMSCAACFINAAAVSFVNDIMLPLFPHQLKMNDRPLLLLAKLGTLMVGVGSIVFALLIPNVLDILLNAFHFWAPIIVVPLIAALLQKEVNKNDFFMGATTGAIALILWTYVGHEPWHISGIVIGVIANLCGFYSSIQWRRINLNRVEKAEGLV